MQQWRRQPGLYRGRRRMDWQTEIRVTRAAWSIWHSLILVGSMLITVASTLALVVTLGG